MNATQIGIRLISVHIINACDSSPRSDKMPSLKTALPNRKTNERADQPQARTSLLFGKGYSRNSFRLEVFLFPFHILEIKMFTIFAILIVIVCIVMTLVVLAQSSKGDGLSGALGGPGSVGAVFGVRRASDFLQKSTIWLGGIFVGLCILANLFFLPTAGSRPSAVQSGQAPVPAAQQAPRQQAAPSGPAAPAPAGAQPGTGQTSPDNSPLPK